MTMKVGLSGFGRIGRDFLRIYFENDVDDFEIVALNASGDLNTLAHLFKYDSLYGKFNGTIEVVEDGFIINGKKIKRVDHRNPSEIPWKDLGVELVIDSTGAFRDREGLSKHIEAGAKKVIVTAPAKNEDITIVMGVNEDKYDPEKHNIISNASCTTNCLAPVAKVVLDNFGIKKGLMTTVHAYTNDQQILDKRHKDLRRARAAALSIIPTTTGAAKAVALVIPELKGKLNGFAMRVPTPTVSVVDVVFEVEKATTAEEINNAFKAASEGSLKGILCYSEEPLVSVDYKGDPRSSIVDGLSTMVIDNMVKVVSWYDNEWGYSHRVVDLAAMVANK
ncbi:glyceraldehyde-3-phosphate dehydrogenase (NAD+) [Keratinibaculum paraultunense]|uniref:Glyceraldehyde-3-phosphate dehydrogenase n=1 Tax=Keratinibaculum paraultunense TaxID=1278232 RepID=A0A4R3KYV5_9FIRM|nr:type I glyceraldehyde-3-phosphate dehydrogenase [Keratinibaculum paraultunense]QQY80275.1 type I glyceraldehyde-3-phosphate dehydrogenase [Keratinibaculum paraultunense]TCS90791.1 glyceraldehyde-3-phosphate dehydrogenase (NAD+) [Keratinibaculum paraultunense]